MRLAAASQAQPSRSWWSRCFLQLDKLPVDTSVLNDSYSFTRLKRCGNCIAFPFSALSHRCRYLDRLPAEYDHLQTKFKPHTPKQPHPRLLPRHVSENLPKAPAGAKTTGFDYEQVKQMIFDCMSAMIEKRSLTVQVRRSEAL
jgi:hypothetical protein